MTPPMRSPFHSPFPLTLAELFVGRVAPPYSTLLFVKAHHRQGFREFLILLDHSGGEIITSKKDGNQHIRFNIVFLTLLCFHHLSQYLNHPLHGLGWHIRGTDDSAQLIECEIIAQLLECG